MIVLYTAGYQGHTIETFLDLLLGNGIERVLDVRQLPFSRKPDFSKKRFGAHLAAAGVEYTHMAALGTPKLLRDEVRRSKDYEAFFAQVRAVIGGQSEALEEALGLVGAGRCLLLCFESDVTTCHRLVVAEALRERQPEIELRHV
jgi:uncharacterized protein (DUF488 family)